MKKRDIVLFLIVVILTLPFLIFGDLIKSKLIEGKTQEEAINIVALETEKNTTQIEENKANEEEKINEILPKIEENTTKIAEVKKEVEEVKVNINEMKNKENSTTTVPVILTGTPVENLAVALAKINGTPAPDLTNTRCNTIVANLNNYTQQVLLNGDASFDTFEKLYLELNKKIKENEDYLAPLNYDENGKVDGKVSVACIRAIKSLKSTKERLLKVQELEKEYNSLKCNEKTL